VDYSGTVTGAGAPYATGTLFSGSFTYDPTASPTNIVSGGAAFPLVAFSFDIGGDQLSDSSASISLTDLGDFRVQSDVLAGTGPLAGNGVFMDFGGTSYTTFATLPSSFPTDFTTAIASYIDNGRGPLGPINSLSQVAAPEPASLTLLGIGAASLLGYGWRRTRAAAAA
jgi:hypothetical protein